MVLIRCSHVIHILVLNTYVCEESFCRHTNVAAAVDICLADELQLLLLLVGGCCVSLLHHSILHHHNRHHLGQYHRHPYPIHRL